MVGELLVRVTNFTKGAIAYRRFAKNAEADGFERVSENGDPLWKFVRGGWSRREIVEVRIAPGGHQLWIKHAEAERA
jgi:hypothetical protein